MKRLLLPLSLVVLAGCHGSPSGGGENKVVKSAEALVRKQVGDPKIKFDHVEQVGDAETGTICGFFTRTNVLGGTDAVRFMVFADGNDGANPYVDDVSAPFPQIKSDFAAAWKKQCVKAGYKDPLAPDDGDKKKTKKKT